MNRSVAVFVALALLLAHTFAIYVDGAGGFAPPYDRSYVAYRLARNLVFEGKLVWNLDQPGWTSYPSLFWVFVAAIPERLYASVNLFCQSLGVVASLATVMLIATQFSAKRSAGLVAPLLLASSGGVAAAGANGLETGLLMLLVTASYTAFERGWKRRLAVALSLACLTHPWGAAVVLLLFVLQVGRTLRRGAPDGEPERDTGLAPFFAPSLVLGVVWIVRATVGAPLVTADARTIFAPDAERAWLGLSYLRDFVVACPSALLVVYPLWFLARGRLSVMGRRALVVALVWMGIVVLAGGGSLPFYTAIVPCLPLLYVAVQEGMLGALDCGSAPLRGTAIVLFGLACAGTALASKAPSRLGPFAMPAWFERWMRPERVEPFGYTRQLGRAGLQGEIDDTEKLRAIGIFLRDHKDHLVAGETLATPWPGSLGYLSGLRVVDMIGRTAPPAGSTSRNPWSSGGRFDLLALFATEPDYLIAFLQLPGRAPTSREVAEELVSRWGPKGGEDGLVERVEEALQGYEMVAVPIYVHYRTPRPPRSQTFFFLRQLDLDRRPQLSVDLDEGDVLVTAVHRGHPQLVDLALQLVDAEGRAFTVRPTGEVEERPDLYARAGHLLYATGSRSIQIARMRLPEHPDGGRWVEIRARLHNPVSPGVRRRGDYPFAWASGEALFELR